jgi:3',5'-cyclic AMP phosphodiesterase CpdA
MDRRTFLSVSALGAAALVFGYESHAAQDTLHLAMLADTHIPADRLPGARGYSGYEQLKSIVPDLIATKADGLVVAGDIAQLEGMKEDYAVFFEIMKPVSDVMPAYIALGNHDDRDNFFAMAGEVPGNRQKVEDKHVTVIEHAAARVILLDSLMYVRKRGGFLGKAQREWLATYLAEHTDRPVALVFHHTLGDGDNDLLDVERLFRLLEPHTHVKALFYGHSHRWEIAERQGIRIVNLPTSAHIWDQVQPIGWVETRFRPDGMELTLHAINGNKSEDGKVFDLPWLK